MLCSQPQTYSTSVLKFNKFGFERSLCKKSLRCKAKPSHACQPGSYMQRYLKLNPDTYTLSAIKLTKKLLWLKLHQKSTPPLLQGVGRITNLIFITALLSCSSWHVAPNLPILEMLNHIQSLPGVLRPRSQLTLTDYRLPQDMEIYSIHKAGLKTCCV